MISTEIAQHFINKGYEVYNQSLVSGGHEISVTKGGFFKAVFGLKTALKIKLLPDENGMINFRAGVGIFGQQVVPTILTLFVANPVAGVAVSAAALVGYAIYEGVRKK